ncbi:hypothetical protein Trichorick_01689 (plasmid) [Candidatus Trichorickettsia mobilis]|uniref:hypothetical protein n=1 Tax=Candidatus Trichorickettsia mobilis TaxID=1346319 RepID=UPI002B25A86E|nr:hypothetical protein [Candidatus Trichorickettsia mobilis]WPY01771.1 hypothetical protein Trichorick_01689 [Candidatus Trichorickettsia mobilis]
MSNQIIFTAEELKHFSKTSPLTIHELSKIIESKTSQQYVIVQKDFVKAISKQLFDNTLHIFDINKFLSDIWSKVVEENRATTDKWKSELSTFNVE